MTQQDHTGRPLLFDRVHESIERNSRWYLAAIILLAALLRLSALGSVPNSFSFEEAIVGYDAYSILHTGADHYGNVLPILTRNFNQYTEALYRYVAAVSVAVFGLNITAVRLPIAVAGVFSVFVLYLFAVELLGNKRIALLAALLLAVSPWHIHHTRLASSSMLLPLFVVAGLTFVLRGRREPKYLIWAGLVFGISLYTYHFARGFVPLIVGGLPIIFWSDFRRHRTYALIGGAVFLVIAAILATFWMSPTGMSLWSETGMAGPTRWVINYWYNLSPAFLFFLGDANPRNLAPGLTPLQYFEVITVVVGVLSMIRSWRHEYWLLVLWVATYPLPASLMYEGAGNTMRLSTGPLLFATISGYGLWRVFTWLSESRRKLVIMFSAIVIAISILLTSYLYFVAYPRNVQATWQVRVALMKGFQVYIEYERPTWQYGISEAFEAVKKVDSDDIYVSADIRSAYIHTLFHTAYPPREAQSVMRSLDLPASAELIADIPNVSFGRYHIRPGDRVLDEAASSVGSMAIVTPEDVEGVQIEDRFETIERIDYVTGEPALYVVRSRNDPN